MIVLRCKNGGFCFGVKRAIETAEKLSGKRNFVLGEIIHNEYIIDKLSKSGIITIRDIEEVDFKEGDKLLIRTHGEPRRTFDKLKGLPLEVIDCTCPFVKEIQNILKWLVLTGGVTIRRL